MVEVDFKMVIVQAINFIALIFILNLLLYKPILSIIKKRNDQINGAEDEVKGLNQKVTDRMADYEEKIRKAKLAAMTQKNEILKDAADEAKQIIDGVRADLPQFLSQYQSRMDKEIADARRVLSDHSRAISLEIAEKVLGRSV